MRRFPRMVVGVCSMALAMFLAGTLVHGEDKAAAPANKEAAPVQAPEGKEALDLKLPKPRFEGTPKNLPAGIKLNKEEYGKKRPQFFVPKGAATTNIAKGKPVTSSDAAPIIGDLPLITDGDKEAADGCFVELAFGKQWVQIDLQAEYNLAAILIWHRHSDLRIYRDVIVQVSNDPDFIKDVVTLFNNDNDNSSGMGIGQDYEYIDNYEGKLVDGKGTKARYVRMWSKGSTADDQNHYTEVEVYGLPAK